MRPRRHRALNRVLAALTVAVLLAVGLVLLLDEGQEPPAQPAPAAQAQCGQPALTYQDGTPFTADTARDVAGVHAAACAGDYDALVPFIRDASQTSLPVSIAATEIVDRWRRDDSTGAKLRTVATVLEQPGIGSQGGLVFCDPNYGLVAFSRGTNDLPPGLGSIEYPAPGRLIDCSRFV